jgi:uncharacterized protein
MSEASTATAPDAFPSGAHTFLLDGPAGALEVLSHAPVEDTTAPARKIVALICHPHPEHGGTMHNKVVTMIERSLSELGIKTVRFNFRGVGASVGEFDEGIGETEDLFAVLEWVQRVLPAHDLILAGFSFGSYVALRAAQLLKLKQLISIAPPVERYGYQDLKRPHCPWLVVQGETDDVVDPDQVFRWAESVQPPVQLIRMPDTGHFFHRKLMDLRGVIKNCVKRLL